MFSSRALAALLASNGKKNFHSVYGCVGIAAIPGGETAKIESNVPWPWPGAHKSNAFRIAVGPVGAGRDWGAAAKWGT